MRKYKHMILLFVISLAVLLSGCSLLPIKQPVPVTVDDSDPSHQYIVYYKSTSDEKLIGKAYTPVKEDFTGIVDELLEAFKASYDDEQSVLPSGVSLKGYTMNVDSLTVDFDGAYLGLSNIDEILLRAGIVKTLVQMPGIYYVSITVDGQPLREADQSLVGPMNEESFVDIQGDNINSYRTIPLDLYFAAVDGKKLISETQEVFCSSNLITERVIVEQIIDGPESENMIGVTSPDVSVNSVTVSNNICVIDLDRTFNEVFHDKLLPETCLYAFVNSICRSCDVDGVQFRIDGESDIRFLGQISLDQTFTEDDSMLADQETDAPESE